MEIEIAENRTEDSSDTSVLKPPPALATLKSGKPVSPPSRQEARPSGEPHRHDIDLSAFEFLEAPFKLVQEEQTEQQNQYFGRNTSLEG